MKRNGTHLTAVNSKRPRVLEKIESVPQREEDSHSPAAAGDDPYSLSDGESEVSGDDEGLLGKETGDSSLLVNSNGKPLDSESEHEDQDSTDGAGENFIPSSRLSLLPNRLSTHSRAAMSTATQKNSIYDLTPPTQATDFHILGVAPALVRALQSMSIRRPTPVQANCIPHLIAGRDCIGNAKTGQGKTVTFAIPILQKLSQDPYGIFALVLTPTRELAFQISEQFAVLGATHNVRTTVVVGGMDMVTQSLELNNRPHVVVATPGRLVDHLNSSTQGGSEWGLGRVKFLVLDEADRLLSSTFAPDLATIFAKIPQDRQTSLFTATLTPSIEKLVAAPPRNGKQKPFVYRDASAIETVDTLKQQYILCPSHIREVYLFHLLCNPPASVIHLRRAPPPTAKELRKQQKQSKNSQNSRSSLKKKSQADDDEEIIQPPPTIIFVTHAKTAAYLTHFLQNLNLRCTTLHSRLTQPQRLASLNLFRACVIPILICTDVGARGLDMDDVGMVINWDLPTSRKNNDDNTEDPGEGGAEETYVHRVGRTARMGKGGFAVSFITERRGDEDTLKKIEKRINVQLTELEMPEEKVLEKLNTVSTAKRLANMELHDSDFGKREEVHKAKKAQRQRKASTPT